MNTSALENVLVPPEHIVILVHGIRTRAAWMNAVQPALENAGLRVYRTNYGRFDLLRFLISVPLFSNWALNRVWTDIQVAADKHPQASVSFVAHSFGTLVVTKILSREFTFKAGRVVFCGSIVPYDYAFEQIKGRFLSPILNDVGTKDYWPAVAESVTWGYGSTGTHGFNRPDVRDRIHVGADHAYFMTAAFAKKYWVPYLKFGDVVNPPKGADSTMPPWWIELISIFRIKYIFIVVAALGGLYLHCRPSKESVEVGVVAFLGVHVEKIKRDVDDVCTGLCRLMAGGGCGKVLNISGEVKKLAVCLPRPLVVEYRDGFDAIHRLAEDIPCLEVQQVGDRRVDVEVRRTGTPLAEVVGVRGAKRIVCSPNPVCLEKIQAQVDQVPAD